VQLHLHVWGVNASAARGQHRQPARRGRRPAGVARSWFSIVPWCLRRNLVHPAPPPFVPAMEEIELRRSAAPCQLMRAPVVASTAPSTLIEPSSAIGSVGHGDDLVLVEIRSEGGRRHNSPLNCLPFFEGDTAEGPLGDEGNTSWLLLPLLVRLLNATNKLLLPLLLRLTSNAKKGKRNTQKTKA
jgi:hypothetical protein